MFDDETRSSALEPGEDRRGDLVDVTAPEMLSRLSPALAARVAALRAVVDDLAEVDLADLDGPAAAELGAELSAAVSRLSAVQARSLPVVEADGLWSTGSGASSFTRWVSARTGSGFAAAQAQVRLGRAMRDHLPMTAAAAAAGVITTEHAHVLAKYAPTTDLRRAALADPRSETSEAWLVHLATQHPVDDFRRLVRHWAAAADPDADDRGYVQASDREYLELGRTLDGYLLRAELTVEHGQWLTQALEAVTPVPAAGDERSTSQRRAQALGDVCRLVIDHGMTGTGRAVRPRVGVLVSHETLVNLAERAAARQAGQDVPAIAPGLTRQAVLSAPQFEDGTAIPRALLDRLACDSEINRYVFGPESQILDVGRAERTFTGHMRSAIIARDKHCRYPGCSAPPAISEGHHAKHWSRDHGNTSVANGILLCWFHHDYVHKRHIDIRWSTTGWVFERNGVGIDAAVIPRET